MSVRPFLTFHPLPGRSARTRAARGMTMVELMVSLAVLALTAVGGVSGFILLNQYASNLRNVSSAKALCQERIEEVQTMPFSPPTILPYVTGQLDTNTYYLLGAAANYDSTGKFIGTGTVQTTNSTTGENVQVYVQQDGATNTVPGVRTTGVSLASLTDASTVPGNPATGTSLHVVTFTVTVTYVFRGKNYSYSMYTLRGPD